MKQIQKLDNLIVKILKEELNKSQKGLLDVIIPKKFAFALMDPRVSDDPSYVSFMKSNDGGTTYNLKIQSKTPEFKELKKAMSIIDNSISIDTPELEKIYNDIMSGIEKADIEGSVDLIKQGRKSGLEEEKKFVTPDGTSKSLSGPQKQQIAKIRSGETIDIVQQGKIDSQKEASEEEEQKKEILENEVKASDIAGQVSEIVDKLKTMAEAKEDPKKQKLAEKAMKQMESAKAALEALTAHEMMLEEKRQKDQEKLAEKNLKGVRKHLTKLVKEPSIVEKISSKMNAKRMAELKSKMKKELDEEQLARVMLQQSLKEGWIK
jgi:hypothetical protein